MYKRQGYRLAQLLPEFSHIARGILTHHERWDGTGYPLGLKGEEIPLIARIVSVVDSYDSIINDKVYSCLLYTSQLPFYQLIERLFQM